MDDQWRKKATGGMDALEAGMALNTLGAYPAVWKGIDVIVVAIMAPQEGSDGDYTGQPIAIFCTDAVLAELEVPHATTVREEL